MSVVSAGGWRPGGQAGDKPSSSSLGEGLAVKPQTSRTAQSGILLSFLCDTRPHLGEATLIPGKPTWVWRTGLEVRARQPGVGTLTLPLVCGGLKPQFFSFYEPASSLIKQGWWGPSATEQLGKTVTAETQRGPEFAWNRITREVSKMLGHARPLCIPSGLSACLGSELLSGAWSVSPAMWQSTAEMFGAGLGPTHWLLWPGPPLHKVLSVHSLLSHKLIFRLESSCFLPAVLSLPRPVSGDSGQPPTQV